MKSGLKAYYDHRATARWRVDGIVSFEEYKNRCQQFRIPFMDICGFKHTLIAIDDMHANDQGFCPRATGSILVWLCENLYFGPPPFRVQLLRAYNVYKQWCIDTKQESRVVQFTAENLHVGRGKYVYLTSKAADARHFSGFVYDVLSRTGPLHGVQHYDLAFGIVWGLRTYYNIEYTAGRWLSDDDIRGLREACSTMLVNYTAMHVALDRTGMFRPKPKDHQIAHLIEDWAVKTRVNPRFCANYKNENFVRLMKRLYRP